MSEDLQRRVHELEAELGRHRRARALARAVDERLEEALRHRQPLERVVPELLAILCEHAGARGAAVRTLDESLSERTFTHGHAPVSPELFAHGAGGESPLAVEGGGCALAHRLDVAGEDFGLALSFHEVDPSEEAAELLEIVCEGLDNHLAAIAQARRQYEVIRAISDALKEPVLERGIERAIEVLRREVDFENLVLLFRHEDELESGALRYLVYQDGALAHDSAAVNDRAVDALMREHAAAFLDGDDEAIRRRFGITRYREEVLITGVRAARVIGRMLVTSRQGEFHTYDRELLDRFADYLRQRIVDFNREWKQLALVFSNDVCERLLREEGYVERWLTPRDRETAILYGDIAGFTRLSEGVLKTPEAIGRLIDIWTDAAVEILWDTGGAFDKMVGDCVIGLWGPPFFERTPEEVCEAAVEAAVRIRALTRSLVGHPDLPEIAQLEQPLDVAVGVSFCPLSVGIFGPNEDYTGFSSGMNNTARLQGLAQGGQILCMESVVQALGEARFGDRREAPVKNVADPLVFRALRDAPAPGSARER
ncbi:MAG TPA: adenylate/guanylate cyclase domain-containing protein [Sandaracinaceae bacterium LLY-WYZ-13_1]|nr:adenylate/guanylate cyclase domain-containing protein [Sandaracinaceae bacterium LLY-WYZ-13_1]